jgi:hypothetical protein
MRSPTARAMKSIAPPGASGTMKRIGLFGQSEPCAHNDLGPARPAATAPSSNPRRFNFDMRVPSPDTDCESLSRHFTGGLDAGRWQKRRRIIALAGRGTYLRGNDCF